MEQSPHIALLPSPGMGHFIPMVEFAKRLTLQHNFSTTLIVPDPGPNVKLQKAFLEALPKERGMSYILLPPPNLNAFEFDLKFEVRMAITISRSLPSIRDVLNSLAAATNLVALVVDFFGTHAFDVAREFDVPPYMLFPSTSMSLSLFLHLPELDAKVSCQYKDLPEPFHIPGCRIPLHGKDFPEPVQDRNSISYQLVLNNVKMYRMAEGIIVNSFEELEGGVIKALRDKVFQNPPVYPVGPLVQTDHISISSSPFEKWLDDQPLGSVLFICFGSLKSLSHAQLHELAFGIETSQKRFLWVFRSPKYSNDERVSSSTFLPEGFVERTKGRGFIMSDWAPQARILRHGSTGGFLTHCGWNSALESIVNGVPMIAWPLGAEQRMNAVMLSEDLKIVLWPKANEDGDGLVGRVAIANVVKNLMEEGEERKQICERMRDLKDAAAKVVSREGSSTNSMLKLISKWKQNVGDL
ncbi:hypothetical protein ACH5RR_024171 [Cinchona calisaya]|uniref:Glycosyltransferase n=1 Tax=Cinchona calisaya TaxID=153742 RepID=A0ABD2ZE40_9GENT